MLHQGRAREAKLKRAATVGVVVLAVLAAGAWIAIGTSYPLPDEPEYALDLAAIRALAGTEGLPVGLHALVVAEGTLPRGAQTAGAGFSPEARVYPSFQLVWCDRSIVLEAPHDEAQHRRAQGDDAPFHADRYARLQAALDTADAIYISHVHGDHLGGVAASPHMQALLPKFRVNPEQRAGLIRSADIAQPDIRRIGFPVESFDAVPTVDYASLHRAAPGLVLIRSPGHTPGHQLFYIRLADGREYLYVGDLVWSFENVVQKASRPYVVSRFIVGEDSRAVAHQLAALIRVHEADPERPRILVAHDKARLVAQQEQGHLGSDFVLPRDGSYCPGASG